ncbi:MAG: hypothetical protein Q9221_002602 [Calogaya cf. arnoldii]
MTREDIVVYSFWEMKPMTGLYGLNGKIVDDFSSIIGDAAEGKEGIDANHLDMCRFRSKDDAGYRKVSGEIKTLVHAASQRRNHQVSNDLQECNCFSIEHGRTEADESIGPAYISAQVRQKIIRDKTLNLLDGVRNSMHQPIFKESCLVAASNYPAPASLFLGSSAFGFAHTLELLPGQPNSRLLAFEDTQLSQLVVDSTTYYSRISQMGLLRLICAHFHSITGDGNDLSVKTDIGTFKFSRLESCTTVQFNARERTRVSIAPRDQDFDVLQQCALGRYCRQENINDDYFGNASSSLPPRPLEWKALQPKVAVAFVDLKHPDYLRFMTQQQYDELSFECQFANEVLNAVLGEIEQYLVAFDTYTQQGLEVLKSLSLKTICNPEHFKLVLTSVRWVLGGTVRAPPRPSSYEPDDGRSYPANPVLTSKQGSITSSLGTTVRPRPQEATEQHSEPQGD